jgi:hypothetical protein
MFPFIVKYKKPLHQDFGHIDDDTILKSFIENLMKEGVDRISIKNTSLFLYENAFLSIRPGLSWNIWVGVSRGQIEIIKTQNTRVVSYMFNTSRFFILGLIAGLLIGLITQTFWIGLLGFTVLGVLNWGISIIRHWLNFSDLLNKILIDNKNSYN